MKPGNVNRLPLTDSPIFAMRGEDVKWPTIRKAWLVDPAVERIKKYVENVGRSIIFLDGTYRTNLNQWTDPPRSPYERAIFFEFLVKHPKVKGGIYILSWIGDYHNGCIIHFAYQYPQVRCWHMLGENVDVFLERKAYQIYKMIVTILYDESPNEMDQEVKDFLEQPLI